jgi:regulator of sirC expression with transglutaminase-like and TPR domain
MPFRRALFTPFLGLALSTSALADEPKHASPQPKSVEELAKELRPSIVVITARGRETRRDSLGTGFIVGAEGLIATNMHVIGEGRPLTVEMADGKKFDVKSVQATDRARDLALIKIDAKDLPALSFGDADKLKDGQAVVAVGNPQGLKHSVVAGVVSGRRDIDGASMIQLAIPLEPGNSGGPLVDMQGRVQGVITLKSLVTENLGFAVPVNVLKPLMDKPHPITMEHWVTIGMLDPDEWKPAMGAAWRQRAGRIKVEGAGSGFGGRSICVHQPKPPELPFEVAVTVKLNDEKGAAGLIFRHDGERHYGFYPTGGKLRLTRFDGPDVFSWKILEEVASPHYRPSEWNTIKVRITKDGAKCFVNDQLAIDSKDAEWTDGQVGLAKFRDTTAEFRQFRVAKKIDTRALNSAEVAKLLKPFEEISPKKPAPTDLVEKMTKVTGSGDALRAKARELEQQAVRLRELAGRVHQQRIYDELGKLLAYADDKVDLIHAALLIAKLDNEDVDVEAYRAEFDRMGKKLAAGLPAKADDKAKLAALNKFFFDERGFHGSRADYYTRSNSYLNEVIDDREGLPITLSVLYAELGRRIGLKLDGIPMPGHFVVRQIKEKDDGPFIDVYDNGKTFDLDEAKKRIEARGLTFRDDHVKPAAKKMIVGRILQNLLHVSREEQDLEAGLRYLDGIVMLEPDAHEERFMRSVLRYNKGMKREALDDVNFLLDHVAEGSKEKKRLQDLQKTLEREIADE